MFGQFEGVGVGRPPCQQGSPVNRGVDTVNLMKPSPVACSVVSGQDWTVFVRMMMGEEVTGNRMLYPHLFITDFNQITGGPRRSNFSRKSAIYRRRLVSKAG